MSSKQINSFTWDGIGRSGIKSTALNDTKMAGIRPGNFFIFLLAGLILVSFIPLALADDGDGYVMLTTDDGTSGVVTGGLYVNAIQPVPFGDQGLAVNHAFTVNYQLPDYSNITWARLYEVWYSGSGTNNYGVHALTIMNGNTLGDEHLHSQSWPDGTWVYVNDHTSKVYSDYFIWYDVTSQITNTTPSVYLWDGAESGYPYVDGRLKAVELVIAYNNSSSSTQTYYWVNQGQEWFFTEDQYPYLEEDSTNFDTSAISGYNASTAKLTEMSTSSKDAFYYLDVNDNSYSLSNGQPGSPYNYFNNNTWDVASDLHPIPNSITFRYHHSDQTGAYGAGSYQIQTATLAITV
jgi:hypothetical protein